MLFVTECVKSCPVVLVHGVHTYICLGLQVKSSKALVKAFKDDTRSYCLSALANAAVDCLYWFRVLCPGRSLMLNSLVGGVRARECEGDVLVPAGEGTGQQCSMGNAESPPIVECFSSLSQTEEPRDFNGKKREKSSPLCVCA